MSTVMVKFVQVTCNLATFVIINNISAVTEPILNQTFSTQNFFGPIFFWTRIFFNLELFYGKKFLDPISLNQRFLVPNNFCWDPKLFWIKMFLGKKKLFQPIFFYQNIFSKISFTKNFLIKIFLTKFFLNQKCFLTKNFISKFLFLRH